MQTAVWGEKVWDVVHGTALGVASTHPATARLPTAVAAMMRALRGVLPCTFCRKSYDAFIAELERRAGAPLEALLVADFARFT